LADIPTPALVVEGLIVRRNVERMASYAREHDLALRPHTKTHKSLLIAGLQLEAGAAGLTTAKVGEAEVLTEVSDDIFVAYPPVDPARAGRVAELAGRIAVRVAVDSETACDAVGEAVSRSGFTVGVLVDVDVGFRRTGVQNPEEALDLAQRVERADGLRLDGIMCFPGHVNWAPDEQGQELKRIDRKLRDVLDLWGDHGLEARVVSGGSTPTARQSHLVSSLTEIRPGTYVYYDWNSVAGGHCAPEDCAAGVVCTVVSDAVPGKVVVDAGTKALTSDRNAHLGQAGGYGHVVEYPYAKVVRVSEEHGEIDVSDCEERPAVGERLKIIPNHICPAVNLQDHVWIGEEGTYERVRVDARGRLS
jgi:D-serine deaminase-like pyridoxal phosphate-dependent protein